MGDDELTGSEQPLTAQDRYTKDLWEQHGLGEHPTATQIEPVATKMLADVHTMFDAASMVLGRYVNAQEKDIVGPVLMTESPEERYAALLMIRATEQMAKAKK